jgi:hypothetical protein
LLTGVVGVTASEVGAALSHSSDVSVNVPIGGGTLNLVPDSTIPSASLPYANQLISDMLAPGSLYDTCGLATGSRTVAVTYDPPNNEFATQDPNGAIRPVIHLAVLPSPDSTGVDHQFDEILIHETSHALRADILMLEPSTVAHVLRFAPEEEGFAEDCSDFVMKHLADIKKRKEYQDAQPQALPILDSLLRYDPLTQSGIYGPSGYSFPLYMAGEGGFRLLLGQSKVPSLAAYQKAYFDAINSKGAILTQGERQSLLNSLAVIDATPAGDWFLAHDPLFLGIPDPAPVVRFLAFPVPTPFLPHGLAALAFEIDAASGGDFIYTPITSGPVTTQVLDVSGNPVLSTFSTDLSDTDSVGTGYTLQLESKLPAGVYTIHVAATISGQLYSAIVPVMVPPSSFDLYSATTFGPFYVYVVAVDQQGNATNGSLNVTEGTIASSGAGFTIVQAGASGQVTVNGLKFTASPIAQRVVFVKSP